VTARTSPYDYLSTVIYHKKTTDEDIWASDCTNERCYGVPLYRQYLTGSGSAIPPTREYFNWRLSGYDCELLKPGASPTPEQRAICRWPFIRMAGADISQRQTMTVNNGRYYLDTTVSKETQTAEKFTDNPDPKFLNVFAKGQTYYVFFVYAKRTTAQTYQIYVGKDFDEKKMFKPVRVDIANKALAFGQPGDSAWAKPTVKDGLLTVTIDFRNVTDLDPTPQNGLCQPQTYCKASGNACVSALPDSSPLKRDSDYICKSWAVKDLDCPPYVKNDDGTWKKGGCYGFSFTLGDFKADDSYQRPGVERFPGSADATQGLPSWGAKFTTDAIPSPDNKTTGQCYYDRSQPPVSEPCKDPPP
jgi:hypothetical protein